MTFDLFSALVDSRSGASAVFGDLAAARGWPVEGVELYDRWDAHNKRAQRECRDWIPYTDLARAALTRTYQDCDLDADVDADLAVVLESMADWPLWPDVPATVPELARHVRVGLLSNVDDVLFARTRARPLVDADVALTSEQLRAYKPDPRIYRRAQARLGTMVHIASSARDVRGALEAGIPMVRLSRPGHVVDADGPRPEHEVSGIAALPEAVAAVLARTDPRP